MKVELCSFSGYKIHPGFGTRFVRMDAKVSFCFSLLLRNVVLLSLITFRVLIT